MEEKRACPRINNDVTVSVGGENFLVLVDVVDLSREGICFLADTPFKDNDCVYILFTGAKGIDETELEARIWRSQPSGDAARPYKVAAVFVDANVNYLDNVAALMENS